MNDNYVILIIIKMLIMVTVIIMLLKITQFNYGVIIYISAPPK